MPESRSNVQQQLELPFESPVPRAAFQIFANDNHLLNSRRQRARARVARTVAAKHEAHQCTLDLSGAMQDTVLDFSNFIPRRRTRFLDRHFISWVCRSRSLRPLSYKLHDRGKIWIGDVVQMTEAEICASTSASKRAIAALKEDLARVGLKLGMRAPFWKRPVPHHARFG